MPTRAREPSRATATRRNPVAFTLIELLTVVAIIGLLVGMVVPTISTVMKRQTEASTLVRINNLTGGAHRYKLEETGNRFFPGQDPAILAKTISSSGSAYYRAASALLARALFTGYYVDPATGRREERFPSDRWAPYEVGMLDTRGIESGRAYTIMDTHPDAMAIVYYVSRKGGEGTPAQYVANDNLAYTAGNVNLDGNDTAHNTKFSNYVTPLEDDGSYRIRMDGEFVIHAADTRTRLYFEGKLKNWRD